MCAHRISEDENVEGRKIREIIERECSLDERRADSEKTQISIFSVFLWRTASFSTLHLSVLHSINDAVNRWKHSRERKWRFRRMAWSLHPLPPLPPKKSVLMQTHPHFVCTTHFERFASPTLPIRQCSLDDYCVDGTRWKHEGCGFVSNSMCSPCWFMSSSENDAVLCGAAFVSDDVKITLATAYSNQDRFDVVWKHSRANISASMSAFRRRKFSQGCCLSINPSQKRGKVISRHLFGSSHSVIARGTTNAFKGEVESAITDLSEALALDDDDLNLWLKIAIVFIISFVRTGPDVVKSTCLWETTNRPSAIFHVLFRSWRCFAQIIMFSFNAVWHITTRYANHFRCLNIVDSVLFRIMWSKQLKTFRAHVDHVANRTNTFGIGMDWRNVDLVN